MKAPNLFEKQLVNLREWRWRDTISGNSTLTTKKKWYDLGRSHTTHTLHLPTPLILKFQSSYIELWIQYRLNYTFGPLSFPKLWFWSLKKTTLFRPLKFTLCCNFGPLAQFWQSQRWRHMFNVLIFLFCNKKTKKIVIFFICNTKNFFF